MDPMPAVSVTSWGVCPHPLYSPPSNFGGGGATTGGGRPGGARRRGANELYGSNNIKWVAELL